MLSRAIMYQRWLSLKLTYVAPRVILPESLCEKQLEWAYGAARLAPKGQRLT